MIVISGRLFVAPGRRAEFLAMSHDAITAARAAPGCRDFVVAADPVEPDRVNVYEEWGSRADLEAFRGDGPGPALAAVIVSADVSRHHVARSEPA